MLRAWAKQGGGTRAEVPVGPSGKVGQETLPRGRRPWQDADDYSDESAGALEDDLEEMLARAEHAMSGRF